MKREWKDIADLDPQDCNKKLASSFICLASPPFAEQKGANLLPHILTLACVQCTLCEQVCFACTHSRDEILPLA